jgi:hypothetical protein
MDLGAHDLARSVWAIRRLRSKLPQVKPRPFGVRKLAAGRGMANLLGVGAADQFLHSFSRGG